MSYAEATKSEYATEWKSAMAEKMAALRQNNTWILVNKPKNANVLKNRCVSSFLQSMSMMAWLFPITKMKFKSIDHLLTKLDVKVSSLNMFLGIQLQRCPDGSILVHQSLYTKRVLARFNMDKANPVSTPADPCQNLSVFKVMGEDNELPRVPYREAVGSLLFLAMISRPDIVLAVNTVSQYCTNYQEAHWNAIKRILRYLAGT